MLYQHKVFHLGRRSRFAVPGVSIILNKIGLIKSQGVFSTFLNSDVPTNLKCLKGAGSRFAVPGEYQKDNNVSNYTFILAKQGSRSVSSTYFDLL